MDDVGAASKRHEVYGLTRIAVRRTRIPFPGNFLWLKYLPPIARRLHHCRDLSESEPFDFLTWFEYAPEYESAFEDLLTELRASAEWNYVEREVDIRVVRDRPPA